MKNKFLYGALGLFALTSCSNDDFLSFSDKKADLSNKVVMDVTVSEAPEDFSTRAFKNRSGAFEWTEGDQLRVYDSKMQAYDNFAFTATEEDGNYFACDKDNANVYDEANADGTYGYKYAVFTEEGNISLAGWNNGKNIALVRVGYEVDEHGTATEGITFSSTTLSSDENVNVYKSAIPMFGIAQEKDAGSETAALFKVKMYNLTGQATVRFKNGKAAGVEKVRVSSLKLAESKTLTDERFAAIKATEIGQATPDEFAYDKDSNSDCVVELDGSKPLSGWFQAELDEEASATSTTAQLQQIKDKTGVITPNTKAYIEVNVEDALSDGEDVVYVPIVPNEADESYDYLLIEYKDADGWKFLRLEKNLTVTATGTNLGSMLVETPHAPEAITTLAELQEIINEAAELNDDVTYTVTLGDDITVALPLKGADESTYTLTIPAALKKNVTLNIKSDDSKKIVAASSTETANVLYIETEEGATGTLTINSEVIDIPMDITCGGVSLGLVGKYSKAVKVNGALTLGNVEFKADVEATSLTVNGNVTAETNVAEAGIALKVTNALTVAKDASIGEKINVSAATATVSGTVDNLTATGATSVTGGKVGTLTFNGETSANITINTEPDVTKFEPNIANYPNAEYAVENLNIEKSAAVLLNAGAVKTITIDEAATETTIASKGTSFIGKVTGAAKSIKSELTEGTKAIGNFYYNANSDIYTAAQLIRTVEDTRGVWKGINIKADEIDLKNYEWTGMTLYQNNGTVQGISDTKQAVIKNIKLTGEGFINTCTSSTTIKNIKFDGISYNDNEEDVNGVGLLVGTTTGNVTISNVTITNGKVLATNASYDLGGMIGKVASGKVTISGGSVQANVAGYYNLGCVVGNIAADAEVDATGLVINKPASGEVSDVIKVLKDLSDKQVDNNAGKVALFVGSVGNAGTGNAMEGAGTLKLTDVTTKITSSELKNTINSKWYYNRQYKAQDGKFVYFVGGKTLYNGSMVAKYFVGYSSDETNYTKKETFDEAEVNQVAGTHFNVFE